MRLKTVTILLIVLCLMLLSTCKKEPLGPESNNKIELGQTTIIEVLHYCHHKNLHNRFGRE